LLLLVSVQEGVPEWRYAMRRARKDAVKGAG
jgi:hypothetical protein